MCSSITLHPAIAYSGRIVAPSSKSYAQRALAIAALTQGTSIINYCSISDDVTAALKIASDIGASLSLEPNKWIITGGKLDLNAVINVRESGLSLRMFTPILALGDQNVTIKGTGSLLKRPHHIPLQVMHDLGVQFNSVDGLLPIHLKGQYHHEL